MQGAEVPSKNGQEELAMEETRVEELQKLFNFLLDEMEFYPILNCPNCGQEIRLINIDIKTLIEKGNSDFNCRHCNETFDIVKMNNFKDICKDFARTLAKRIAIKLIEFEKNGTLEEGIDAMIDKSFG